jgi:hypothetical protein
VHLFPAVVVVTLITTLVTPPLIRWSFQLPEVPVAVLVAREE